MTASDAILFAVAIGFLGGMTAWLYVEHWWAIKALVTP